MLAFMTSCTDETTITLLDNIQVSSSYVSVPMTGGADTITIMAKDSFKIEKPATAQWLTVSTLAGAAGEWKTRGDCSTAGCERMASETSK